MSLPAEGGPIALTTATCVAAWIEYPFNARGDVATKVYHHTMQVKRADYAPLAEDDIMTAAGEKPTRSPFADDAVAYWVGDSIPRQIGGDLVEFDRPFANIPVARTETAGVYPFTFPGVSTDPETSVTAIATSTGNESIVPVTGQSQAFLVAFDVSTADLIKFRVGDGVSVNNDADVTDGYFQVFQGGSWKDVTPASIGVISDISGNTVTAMITYDTYGNFSNARSEFALTTYTIYSNIFRSSEITINSSAFEEINYQKADDSLTLALTSKFEIYAAASGDLTNLMDDGFSSGNRTTVQAEDYAELIATGATINAEDASFSRWMGNIWEVRNIKVKAK